MSDFNVEFDGFDETLDQVEELENEVESVMGTHDIQELFSNDFVSRHTEFDSLEKMVIAALEEA